MFDRALFTQLPTRIKRAGLALGAISVFALLLPAGQTLARFTDSQALSTDQSITTGQLSIEAVPNSLSAELRSYQNAPSSKTRTFGGGVTCSPGSGGVAYVCRFGESQLEHLIMSGGDEVRVSQHFITHGEGKNLRAQLEITADTAQLPRGVELSGMELHSVEADGSLGAKLASSSPGSVSMTVADVDLDNQYALSYSLNTFNTRCEDGACVYPGQSGALPVIRASIVQENR